MIERESTVLFFKDLYKTLAVISDEDAGILMKALFAHANDMDPEGLDESPIATALYIGIADQLDRLAMYRSMKADAGRAGGQKSKPKQTEAEESKPKQTEAEVKQTEPPYPYPSPYPTPSPNKESGRFTPPTTDDIKEYARQSGINIDAERFVDFYSSKGWMVGKTKMKDWKAAVRNWAARDRKETPKETPNTDYRSQLMKVDYSELLRRQG